MKIVIRSGLGGALASALLVVSSSVAAAPQYVRLSFTDVATDTMAITWNTTGSEATEVRYGTTPQTYSASVTGTSFTANAGLGDVHEVELTGLSPNTTYYYIAGSDAGGWSPEGTFTTGPVEEAECGSFTFAFVGDNRPDPTFGGGENWVQIVGQLAGHQPRFILNGGDMVIDGDNIGQWLTFLGDTAPVSRNIPMLATIGNHDTGPGAGENANFNQLFQLPRSWGTGASNTEDYYFFTYGNAIFVSLSTDTFTGGTSAFADQAAWLDEVLTNNPKRWKFVYFHKPIYTHEATFGISHAPNEEGQNAPYVTVFDKHHVDVVFTSHNHWYERFEPSACATQGNPGSTEACPVGATNFAGGSVYYVSGGAGAFTIPAILCGSERGRASCAADHHYVLAKIQNETLTLETWGAPPQSKRIFDNITIQKPAVTCSGGSGGSGGAGNAGGAGNTGNVGGAGNTGNAGGSGNAGNTGGSGNTGNTGGSGNTGNVGGAGNAPGTGGAAGGAVNAVTPGSGEEGGCACRTSSTPARVPWLLGLLGLALFRRRRRG